MTYKEFSDQYMKYENYFKRVAYMYVDTEDEIKDLLQSASLKALKGLHNYKEVGYFGGWFSKVIYQAFVEHYRKVNAKRYVNISRSLEFNDIIALHRCDTDNFIEKEFYKLCHEHLSYKEQELMHNMINITKQMDIAEEMGMSQNTLRSTIFRLRNKIRNNPELMRHLT